MAVQIGGVQPTVLGVSVGGGVRAHRTRRSATADSLGSWEAALGVRQTPILVGDATADMGPHPTYRLSLSCSAPTNTEGQPFWYSVRRTIKKAHQFSIASSIAPRSSRCSPPVPRESVSSRSSIRRA
jgi:hypothetical protein